MDKKKTDTRYKMVSGGVQESLQRQEIIQVLRGISCLFVILCHTDYTSFGQTGVDVFLVISGYVIIRSTEFKRENFLIRRVKKIVPLYWTMTILTSALVIAIPQLFRSYEVSLEYFLKSLFFIPYTHNGMSGPVMTLGWTLNYEILFYIIFWIAMKINYCYRGYISVGFCTVLALTGELFELPMPLSFWCSDILLEFCYGILLYEVIQQISIRRKNMRDLKNQSVGKTFLLLSFIFIGFGIMETFLRTRVPRGTGTGVIAGLIVFLSLMYESQVYLPKVLICIGNISYLLYLIHIYPVRLTVNIMSQFMNTNFFTTVLAVAAAVSTGICILKAENRIKLKYKLFTNRK